MCCVQYVPRFSISFLSCPEHQLSSTPVSLCSRFKKHKPFFTSIYVLCVVAVIVPLNSDHMMKRICVLLLSLISFESVLKKKVDYLDQTRCFIMGVLICYCRKCIVDAHVNKAAETTVTNQLGKTKNFLKESQDTPKHKRVFGKVTKEYFYIKRRIFKVTFHKTQDMHST